MVPFEWVAEVGAGAEGEDTVGPDGPALVLDGAPAVLTGKATTAVVSSDAWMALASISSCFSSSISFCAIRAAFASIP